MYQIKSTNSKTGETKIVTVELTLEAAEKLSVRYTLVGPAHLIYTAEKS